MTGFEEWFKEQFPSYHRDKLTAKELAEAAITIIAGNSWKERLDRNDIILAAEDAARKAWLAGFDEGRSSK